MPNKHNDTIQPGKALPKPFLEFKYKGVVMLGDLGDGALHPIPSRMITKPSLATVKSVRNARLKRSRRS